MEHTNNITDAITFHHTLLENRLTGIELQLRNLVDQYSTLQDTVDILDNNDDSYSRMSVCESRILTTDDQLRKLWLTVNLEISKREERERKEAIQLASQHHSRPTDPGVKIAKWTPPEQIVVPMMAATVPIVPQIPLILTTATIDEALETPKKIQLPIQQSISDQSVQQSIQPNIPLVRRRIKDDYGGRGFFTEQFLSQELIMNIPDVLLRKVNSRARSVARHHGIIKDPRGENVAIVNANNLLLEMKRRDRIKKFGK